VDLRVSSVPVVSRRARVQRPQAPRWCSIEAGRAVVASGQKARPWAVPGAGFGLQFTSRPAYLWRP